MRRFLPYPVLSIGLLLMWVLLQGSASPAVLLSGLVIAIAAPWTLAALEMPPLKLRRPVAIVRLLGLVIVDVVRSNIAVATIIYGRKRTTRRASGFVTIPLDMRSRHGLAILSTIITCTPGTLWVQYDSGRNRLLMHIFDLVDPETWPQQIKGRYERLLMEIFE